MDSTAPASDDATELGDLIGQLRAQLARRARLGAWAMPGGRSPRRAGVEGATEPTPEPLAGHHPLAMIREELGACTRCKLAEARTKIVFGVGAIDAPLVFVGEAPGEHEDRSGEPFVGPAGELLDKMIEAMGWTRQAVFITNTVMCRPPQNRAPEADELGACMPFLFAKLDAIAPRIIVALGGLAATTLLGIDAPISALRGTFHDVPRFPGARVMPTFHPAYLLREPERKRDTWADLKLVIAELERLGVHPPNPPRA
ncbi:MAG: uracil-DNA glycosylase [Proteobacteria bacterium]|nr:uracil-DNA glycosylase [Pseudomonadota bacterium]